MKKILHLILVLTLAVSLCACTGGPSPEEQEKIAKYDKYEDLISLLEKEDYEAALADVEARMPEPTEPEFTEIKITMDNYLDYFTVNLVEDWHINGFGEADELNLGHKLQLKEEYKNRLTNIENTKIDIEFTSKAVYYNCDFDMNQKTYNLKGINYNTSGASDGIENRSFEGWFFTDDFGGGQLTSHHLIQDWNVISIPEEFEVLRIQGSIFLTE